jgi:hypothetical protein
MAKMTVGMLRSLINEAFSSDSSGRIVKVYEEHVRKVFGEALEVHHDLLENAHQENDKD